jgi:RND family efflux transporter MFP subunit
MNIKKLVLPILIVALGVGVTMTLVKSRKAPQPQEKEHLGPLIEISELQMTAREVVVSGTGSVQARHEVSVTPQVRGRVVEISPQMVVGGVFSKDEQLFAIEDVDYQLAIDLARSNLAQAELELMRTENLADVARQEWVTLNPDSTEEPNPMVVYEPQLKSAMAVRDAAMANLKQAEINLQRTRILAPFNCYVRSEQIEIGQYLNAGSPVAAIAGTDQVEIVVPLPLDQLAWLDVPTGAVGQKGSLAEVELRSGGAVYEWQGYVSRALGEIDPHNRMARVVVTVDEPFSKEKSGNPLDQLLPGMFVEVNIQGVEIEDVFVIPRGVLRDHETIWTIDADNKLRIRNVEIIRRERDEVLVRSGLNSGDRLVVTNLSAAAEGMKLRPMDQETSQ